MDKETKQDLVAILVDTYYGWQEPRKAFYNSARNLVRRKIEDLPLRVPEDKREDKAYLKRYVDSNLEALLEEIAGQDLDEVEKKYLDGFIDSGKALKEQEKKVQALMEDFLTGFPEWKWLQDIRGISRVLAVNLIRYFDINRAKHVSSFWKVAGLHVVDGVSPRRRRGEKLDYNPAARTLMWKVADSFIKQRTEPYRGVYDVEKERQLGRVYPVGELAGRFNGYKKDDTKLLRGHAHNRALRYMEKLFLRDYYLKLCEIYGREVDEPYSARFHEAKR